MAVFLSFGAGAALLICVSSLLIILDSLFYLLASLLVFSIREESIEKVSEVGIKFFMA